SIVSSALAHRRKAQDVFVEAAHRHHVAHEDGRMVDRPNGLEGRAGGRHPYSPPRLISATTWARGHFFFARSKSFFGSYWRTCHLSAVWRRRRLTSARKVPSRCCWMKTQSTPGRTSSAGLITTWSPCSSAGLMLSPTIWKANGFLTPRMRSERK